MTAEKGGVARTKGEGEKEKECTTECSNQEEVRYPLKIEKEEEEEEAVFVCDVTNEDPPNAQGGWGGCLYS